MVKSETELSLTFMIPNRVYKFQLICLRGNQMQDIQMDVRTRVKFNVETEFKKNPYFVFIKLVYK